jgi:geranylgeranyl reductase family protein
MGHFDVAVIGAGPAGSWAAYRLARQGARVALVDDSHPREKPCGGGVTGRALDMVRGAVGDPDLDGVEIVRATFEDGPRRATIPIAAGTRGLAVVSRRVFDAALRQAAATAGATLVSDRAAGVTRDGSRWTIALRGGALRAPWIVGADGANSFVRRRVFRPFRRQDLSIASGYFVFADGAAPRDITIAFEHEPAGYLWSFPRRDHLAVGVGAQADASSSSMLRGVAKRWIDANVGTSGVRAERYSWPIPSLDEAALAREEPAGAGWMLAGDAGGLVDPITREGIYFALASGDAAAASLAESDPARAYSARIREGIHDELRRAARLKSGFFDPRFTALLVSSLVRCPRIQAVMADLVAGRQTYRGLRRRLLRTLEVRLMFELLFARV